MTAEVLDARATQADSHRGFRRRWKELAVIDLTGEHRYVGIDFSNAAHLVDDDDRWTDEYYVVIETASEREARTLANEWELCRRWNNGLQHRLIGGNRSVRAT